MKKLILLFSLMTLATVGYAQETTNDGLKKTNPLLDSRYTIDIKGKMTLTTVGYAQETTNDEVETTKPLLDVEIVRRCARIDIEGKTYNDVVVTIESSSPESLTQYFSVKILVEDKDGENIYKVKFKHSFLYVYRKGTINVGQLNFNQLIISKDNTGEWIGMIREKEGIFE